ncbi:MAG: hypothetical protein ABIR79_07225 [Candidatus Binatia bacterium]
MQIWHNVTNRSQTRDDGGDGDMIDLTRLFATAPGGGDATSFVNYNAATGVPSVDVNGLTGGANFVVVATLTGNPAASTVRVRVVDSIGAVFIVTANLV